MSIHQITSWVMTTFERFSFQQIALLVMVIVAVGFVCLRGFGSRSNY
jgi:hypothetical protein